MAFTACLKMYSIEVIQLAFFSLHLYCSLYSNGKVQNITAIYLLPQILLLIRNKSSRGISLIFFSLRQAILISQVKDRINFLEPSIMLAALPAAIVLLFNSIIILLIIKYNKRRQLMFTEMVFSITLILLSILYPRIYSSNQREIQLVSVIIWTAMIAIDGSHNISYSIFAPKIFANITKPNYFFGLSGYYTAALVGVMAYKSIVRGESSLMKGVEIQDDKKNKDDDKIKTD